MKNVRYKTIMVQGYSLLETDMKLEEELAQYIGWELQGGISVEREMVWLKERYTVYQTMTINPKIVKGESKVSYKTIMVQGESLEETDKKVEKELAKLINEGWKLQGGASIYRKPLKGKILHTVFQALTK